MAVQGELAEQAYKSQAQEVLRGGAWVQGGRGSKGKLGRGRVE